MKKDQKYLVEKKKLYDSFVITINHIFIIFHIHNVTFL
jgi:hypothetical protein